MTVGSVAASLLAIAVAGVVATWRWSLPSTPDAFYQFDDTSSGTPGLLLRHAAFERGVPSHARAWRILYRTTGADGRPATASAIVLAHQTLPAGPRPVVAWTHGTTGAAAGCGPSLLDDPFANVPALPQLIERGWIYVATDYVGLSAPGTQTYLVGQGEGRAALDAVRAARHLPGLEATGDAVLWGHSQGGHAALWAAILAPRYASDVPLVGVAVAAPASLPGPLMKNAQGSVVGKIMSAFVLRSYAETYADVDFDRYVRPGARLLVRDMARRCLAGREALVAVFEAWLLDSPIMEADPTTGALGRRLDENVPRGRIGVPVLVAQGLTDDLVIPAIQDAYVRQQCEHDQTVDYRRYAARDHLQLVAPASPFADDLIHWTEQRFAGEAGPASCTVSDR